MISFVQENNSKGNNWSVFLRHLNGTALQSFVRPAVLITDAYNALNNQLPMKQRERAFIGIAFSPFFTIMIIILLLLFPF